MRNCFVHVGTHKTGTTAIQRLLSRSSSILADKGYLYPRAGRLEAHPGHHNIAWEISGDRRYQVRNGTITDLLQEVSSSTRDVLLSSEDLECALYASDRFADFVSRLQSNGFKVTFILYVRSQVGYLPRIYLTLIPFGLETTYDRFLAEVLEGAEFRWQDWVFDFDYVDLLGRLQAIPGVEVLVRSYDRVPASVCSDFLSLFGLGLKDVGLKQDIVANASLPVQSYLRYFFRNRFGRDLSAAEQEAVLLVAPGTDIAQMSPAAACHVHRRFFDGNRKFAAQCGIPGFGVELPTNATCSDHVRGPYVDEIFSAAAERRLRKFVGAGHANGSRPDILKDSPGP
jgi:hypothetical protein